ncbi:hypothetical protein Lal_00024678 [Lupinus albus]|nr:hypothetical protein Lal_00024678 [Lupinus albus]
MKLRQDHEVTRAVILNKDPVPSFDVCAGKLLRKEQQILTPGAIVQDNITLAAVTVTYAGQGKEKWTDTKQVQGYSFKEFGHFAGNSIRKLCSYCKQNGHIVKECSTRPENRHVKAFEAVVHPSSSTGTGPLVFYNSISICLYPSYPNSIYGTTSDLFSTPCLGHSRTLPTAAVGDIDSSFHYALCPWDFLLVNFSWSSDR